VLFRSTLQTEIATAVTQSLRVKLTPDLADVVEAGGTRNPQALDLYFKALQFKDNTSEQNLQQTVALLTEAIALDLSYADAYAERAVAEGNLADIFDPAERIESRRAESRKDIENAIRLAPQVALNYNRYADCLSLDFFDLSGAQRQYALAQKLAPNDARIISGGARFESLLGHRDEAAALSRRVILMNPSSAHAYFNAAVAFGFAGFFDEALKNADHAKSLGDNRSVQPHCIALLGLHRYQDTLSDCPPTEAFLQEALAVALMRLNRPKDAQAMFDRLFKENGDAAAYQYAAIYAQWGDKDKALAWLEKAYAVKDGGLLQLKVDFMLDPIRNEPRFQAVLRKMNFPP
jgi:tetratricopeptide (TPR) repeat protein